MKFWVFFLLTIVNTSLSYGQTTQAAKPDSMVYGTVSVTKDDRIDLLGEKMLAYNIALAKNIRSAKGYRLMLLSTSDRNLAMDLRTKLLRQYPEHKVYMAFQSPFIKLKMGNFEAREEAEDLRKLLLKQKVTTGNIYIIPETVELNPVEEEEDPE
jgi:hypothetical protein